MKKKQILIIASLAILLNACLVKSLHPFYFEDDVIFNTELLGTWIDQDSTVWEIKQFSLKKDSLDNSYYVSIEDSKSESSKFNVHLFKLEDNYYLDFFPDELPGNQDGILADHFIPTHSIAKLEMKNNEDIKISWFNEEWLGELFTENRIKIAHEEMYINEGKKEKTYILTGSTLELRKFLIKYGDDPKAFSEDGNFPGSSGYALGFKLKKLSE